MGTYLKWRIWFWILIIPVGVSSLLAMQLRQAASDAQLQSEGERLRAEHEAALSARGVEQKARLEKEQAQQQENAQRCGRAVRSMLPTPPAGPLLVVITRQACPYGCPLLKEAERLVQDNTLVSLGGVWVPSSAANNQLNRVQSRPVANGMRTVIADTCQELLSNGRRQEDFILLSKSGDLLHVGVTSATNKIEPGAYIPPETAPETLRAAIRSLF